MNWKVRHEGSPEWVERTLPELEHGLADGVWETTDEVQEPGTTGWVAFEAHPHFAEVCEELEVPPKPVHADEAHLDMNALIDVTMVLLIFFILTTTMAALQKRIEAPSIDQDKKKDKVKIITTKEIEEQTVHVKAQVVDGKTVITVEGKPAQLQTLAADLKRYATKTKTSLLLEMDGEITQDEMVQIIDKAKVAGLEKVLVP
jgi:biopolymer transport protein ExbD